MGAESISLDLDYDNAENFRESGYEEISTNKDYIGGLARQYGGLSFSRVFLAGHSGGHPLSPNRNLHINIILTLSLVLVSSYQPETVYQIFMRAMFNKDVPTGEVPTDNPDDPYQSTKTPNPDIPHEFPSEPPIECSIWDAAVTCTENQMVALGEGTAVVEGGVVVSPEPEVEGTP